MPPIIWHRDIPVPGPLWLLIFAVLGTGIAYFVFSDDERLLAPAATKLRLAMVIGLVAGAMYWWVARYALDNLVVAHEWQSGPWYGKPQYLPGIVIDGLASWAMTWLVAAVLLQRRPELTEGDFCYDLVSKVSGLAAAAILVVNVARVLVATR